MSINQTCKQCQKEFSVDNEELALLDKLSPTVGGQKLDIPVPTHCFSCRAKRRLGWRNERSLYNRKCDKSGKEIVSVYPPDSEYKVFEQKEWWGDGWDAKDYGQDFDFTKSFFEQFAELNKKVPKCALLNKNPDNSDYLNRAEDNKDSYMSFDLGWNEKIFYSRTIYNCNNLIDCTFCRDHCSFSYECLNCNSVVSSSYCIDSSKLSECHFCFNLHGCQNCIFCANLHNKQYCIENKQYSKEEFEQKLKEYDFGSYQKIQEYKTRFANIVKSCVHKYASNLKCENCSGDYLENCKNIKISFGVKNSENGRYMFDSERGKDTMDDCFSGGEGAELNYEVLGAGWPYNTKFNNSSWHCSNVIYINFCQHCKDCFGCSNMKRAQYCILNKQYSKEEYEKLIPKIVEHMKKTGEWGEFFPLQMSEFSYNESVANEYFPQSKEEVLQNGWKWKDKVDNLVPSSGYVIADNINEITNEILEKVLVCEVTKRPYKIQSRELAFYIEQNIPIPHKHPDQRHHERLSLRNALKLHHRQCMCEESDHDHSGRCPVEFETTYAPDRPEKVYCENCYQKTVI
ncbi:MAG: hypothetical protein OEV37_01780 [Candidatus Berkelbacteria bacterium]|nr:hypothetical protein [Candidatus Berkelbacteria bacterium]